MGEATSQSFQRYVASIQNHNMTENISDGVRRSRAVLFYPTESYLRGHVGGVLSCFNNSFTFPATAQLNCKEPPGCCNYISISVLQHMTQHIIRYIFGIFLCIRFETIL